MKSIYLTLAFLLQCVHRVPTYSNNECNLIDYIVGELETPWPCNPIYFSINYINISPCVVNYAVQPWPIELPAIIIHQDFLPTKRLQSPQKIGCTRIHIAQLCDWSFPFPFFKFVTVIVQSWKVLLSLEKRIVMFDYN